MGCGKMFLTLPRHKTTIETNMEQRVFVPSKGPIIVTPNKMYVAYNNWTVVEVLRSLKWIIIDHFQKSACCFYNNLFVAWNGHEPLLFRLFTGKYIRGNCLCIAYSHKRQFPTAAKTTWVLLTICLLFIVIELRWWYVKNLILSVRFKCLFVNTWSK